MFKIKVIALGLIVQISLILIFTALTILVSINIGNVLSSNYMLALEFVFTLAAGISSFMAARIAWEKAFYYGIFFGIFAVILRIIVSIIFMVNMSFFSALVKFSILISFCVCCAMLSVTIKKKSKF